MRLHNLVLLVRTSCTLWLEMAYNTAAIPTLYQVLYPKTPISATDLTFELNFCFPKNIFNVNNYIIIHSNISMYFILIMTLTIYRSVDITTHTKRHRTIKPNHARAGDASPGHEDDHV